MELDEKSVLRLNNGKSNPNKTHRGDLYRFGSVRWKTFRIL